MNFKKVFISELSPAKYNPRKDLTDKDPEYQRIKRSIEEFGYVDPVIVNADYTVIGGHQRLKVLKELGHAQIDVVVVDIPKNKEKALNVALNKISGDWDQARLAVLLEEIKLDGMLEFTGFDDKEFDQLLRELHKDDEPLDSEPQISRAEELRKEWGTEVGQLWQCGDHRVICGDCTDKAVVERVMQGEKADMVFTDPPYGIGVDIANDNLSLKKLEEWNGEWLKNLQTVKNVAFISYHSTRTFPALLIPAMKGGWFFERMLWLTRPDKFPVNSWNGWVLISQAILLFSKGKPEYLKISPADQDVYKHTAKELGDHSGHPTEKILGHIQSVMGHFKADIILDPFLGSGTTMIACENLGRKCRGCEIDPGYVAVILQRYKDTFKKEPVLMK